MLGKDAAEAREDTAGLRKLLQLKNRELQTLRTHAATILEQRTEESQQRPEPQQR